MTVSLKLFGCCRSQLILPRTPKKNRPKRTQNAKATAAPNYATSLSSSASSATTTLAKIERDISGEISRRLILLLLLLLSSSKASRNKPSLREPSTFAGNRVGSIDLDVRITAGDQEERVGGLGAVAVAGGDDGRALVHAFYFGLHGGEEEGCGCDLQSWEGDVFALHSEVWWRLL